MRVLHVVESFGAGTASAIGAYATSTPDLSHHLLRRIRTGEYFEDGGGSRFESVSTLSGQLSSSVRQIREAIRSLRPDVVHAHSSWAGAFLRGTVIGPRKFQIVYTPHGYAFDRRDIGRAVRSAFWLAEAALTRNTDVIAACSEREAGLAHGLHKRANVVLVPNVVDAGDIDVPAFLEPSGEVVGVGRLTPARDPDFFAAVVDALRRSRANVRVTWIGGGEAAYVDRLTRAGVEVTGWVPRSEAMRRLASAAVYVHPSRWDASPMTLLEANALGVPIAARSIATLAGSPPSALGTHPSEVAAIVHDVLSDERAAKENVSEWTSHLAKNSRAEQRRALLAAYSA